MAGWAVILGCYAHAVVPPKPPVDHRPKLIAPTTGRYLITREDQAIGEETFAITSSAGVWRAVGRLEMRWPVERAQGYVLEIDQASREPLAVEAWIEVIGEKQSVHGRRDAAAEYFDFTMDTISGSKRRQIPYAPGTVIDFPSPIFNTLVLSMLGPTLKPKTPVRVRTISVSVPQMEPAVMIQTYELHGVETSTTSAMMGSKRIAISSVGSKKPNAFWVREDGLPIKVRTWIDEGSPFVLQLEERAH